jgi:hypothetical protein|tara:strand:+ start:241 stop:612 length:372 start_codon:yes stop_codon:yes gene_type:complete
MATNATWSVIFDDKTIVKQAGDAAGTFYVIDDDDTFWNQSKFSNIWAVQYGTSVTSDEVEYRDTTPHSSWADANLGNFQDFIDKWDSAHLLNLQSAWDDNNVEGETSEEKIERLGARPTSYSS